MLPEFKNLTEEETSLMLMTPALVTLLIAGVEGDIDKKEMDWGGKIAHFRANADNILQGYYREADNSFPETLNSLIKAMPEDVKERSEKIKNELSKLNDILPKLDPEFSREFYNSMRSLSRQVAQASGGVWGYGSISPEEQKYLDLESISPPEGL